MGITRRYVEAEDFVVTVWDGVVTAHDWAIAVKDQSTDPALLLAGRRLTDTRTVAGSRLSPAEVTTVGTSYDDLAIPSTGVRLAIVTNEGWAVAQLVKKRMQTYGVSTQVFDEVHTACAWLGIDAAIALTTIGELRQELRSIETRA